MQMCPDCEKVYDESEYSRCPYCSGELVDEAVQFYKSCPRCGDPMYWDGEWKCGNCGHEIYTDIDDYDGIIEG